MSPIDPQGGRGWPPSGLWLAVRFLSRLPTPDPGTVDHERIAASLAWYPVVGLLLGGLLAGLAWVTAALGGGPLLTAGLVLLAWVGLTGALHLDGLADMADAWVGGQGDRERTLAILKDMAIGPVGVAVVVAILLLKFAGVAETGALALLLALVIGRMVPALLFLTTPYVRPGGLGDATRTAPRLPVLFGLGLAVLFILAMAPLAGLLALVVAAGVLLLLRAWMVRRLGGITGDTIGASMEVTEAVVLVVLALFLI